jgi:hypothetical protein
MSAHDRIRLTGSLSESPASAGLSYLSSHDEISGSNGRLQNLAPGLRMTIENLRF